MPLFKALTSVKDKFTLSPNELMLKEATSNDDVAVSNATLHQISDLTFHPSEYPRVMEAVWTSIRSPRQEWRRIQRGLLLADTLMKFGSSRCVQELRDYSDRFKGLQTFKYSDEDGDRGVIIREKSRFLFEILPDFARIEQERETAKKFKNKCVGMSRDDVYRGEYKKNSNSEDVRSSHKPKEKSWVPQATEKTAEEVPRESVRQEIKEIPQRKPQVVEERKVPAEMPYFEPARFDRNMHSSVSEPILPNFHEQRAPVVVQENYRNPQNLGNPGIPVNPGGLVYAQQPEHPPNYNQYGYPQQYPPQTGYGVPYQQFPPPQPGFAQNPYGNQGYPPNNPYPPQYGYPQGSANNYGYNPAMNYAPQNQYKPVVHHNMPNFKDQAANNEPKTNNLDLESQLMNLDGLELSLAGKRK